MTFAKNSILGCSPTREPIRNCICSVGLRQQLAICPVNFYEYSFLSMILISGLWKMG